ncbi:hypothetical protein V8C86DRAFT_2710500 [Haematococcus lacustris]
MHLLAKYHKSLAAAPLWSCELEPYRRCPTTQCAAVVSETTANPKRISVTRRCTHISPVKTKYRERIAGTHARRLCTARRALHPPVLPLPASYAMMAGAAYTLVLFLSMVLTPRLRAVQQFMTSLWVFAPVALIYLGLLAYSWTPDTLSILFPGSLQEGLSGGFKPQFFPRLPAIAQLFSQPATAASLVVHVLSINLFLGRQIYLEGLRSQTPTRVSLLLTWLLGPLGLVAHWATKAACLAVPALRAPREAAQQVVLEAKSGGQITLLPYPDT